MAEASKGSTIARYGGPRHVMALMRHGGQILFFDFFCSSTCFTMRLIVE